MKKNLLKLLALGLVMGLFAGCSDSSSDDDKADDKVCTISQTSALTSVVGAAYTAACSASNGAECTATGDVDTATVATYALAFTAKGCTDTAGSVSVVAESNTPVDGKILPF